MCMASFNSQKGAGENEKEGGREEKGYVMREQTSPQFRRACPFWSVYPARGGPAATHDGRQRVLT